MGVTLINNQTRNIKTYPRVTLYTKPRLLMCRINEKCGFYLTR